MKNIGRESCETTTGTFKSVFALSSCFFALLALGESPALATDKCGAVCDETWILGDSPYTVTCDVTVATGCTLTIDAGVEVRFLAGTGPRISGTLDVNGALGSEVMFTSDSASPAVGDWTGLVLQAGSSTTIDHAAVSWASDGVFVDGTTATLNQLTVTQNTRGVFVRDSSTVQLTGVVAQSNETGVILQDGPTVTASGCTFTDNTTYGILITRTCSTFPPVCGPDSSLTVTGSSIHSNSAAYDLHTGGGWNNPSSVVVEATGNWWGTSDPTEIASRIYDHADSESRAVVNWCGWLDGAGGVPARDVHCPDLTVCDETVVWSLTDKPYLLVSDLVVCPTGTLQIDPGVEIRSVVASPKLDVAVAGSLDVNGASGSEVMFTSDSASPAVGDWTGLVLQAGSSTTIDHAAVSWAGDGVFVDGTTATLNQLTVTQNTRGVFVRDSSTVQLTGVVAQSNETGVILQDGPTVTASGCTFTDNTTYGILITRTCSTFPPVCGPDSSLTVTGSSIHSNSAAYDLHTGGGWNNPSSVVVEATGNWWGTSDPTEIASRIYDHADSESRAVVNWCGWLDGAGGVPARDVHCPDLTVCDETVVWSLTDKPYLLVSDLVVCPTGTLQIDPGVEIRAVVASPKLDVAVAGSLDVNGASGSEVMFTSDSASPAVGDWTGLVLQAGSSTTIDHAAVSWASDGVFVDGTTATLNQLTVTQNTRGVFVRDSSTVQLTGVVAQANEAGVILQDGPTVTASGCTFTDNTTYGILITRTCSTFPPVCGPDSSLTVTGSSIHSNSAAYDLHTGAAWHNPDVIVWAPDNWWGTSNYDYIRGRIYDHEDSTSNPFVYFHPFGPSCEIALVRDTDADGLGDFDDNCPIDPNYTQADADGDGMGDPCDPEPGLQPVGPCNGMDDTFDGYADADADGWGDPCDFQPTRDDSYPGAPEICDGRDNDGDALFALDELADADLDGAITCGDCDDFEPEVYPCACESCINLREDDCDGLTDGGDPECFENPYCVIVSAGAPEPGLHVEKAACGGATLSGPFDVIRGHVAELHYSSGSVDLGNVVCAGGGVTWDRVTDLTPDPNPACNDTVLYFAARDTGAADFGSASPGGEPRDVMSPDPVCP